MLIRLKRSTSQCPATLPLAIFLVEFLDLLFIVFLKFPKKWNFATGISAVSILIQDMVKYYNENSLLLSGIVG